MEDFVRTRGMLGYAPTQGHIPSAVVYLGHALDALRNNEIKNALFISKGSLFLGRMSRGALIFLPLFRWIATELSGDFSMRTTSSFNRSVTPMLRI